MDQMSKCLAELETHLSGSGPKKTTLKQNDLVWVVRVQKTNTKTFRVLHTKDFNQGPGDFADKDEEIFCFLGLVMRPSYNKSSSVYPVYDGITANPLKRTYPHRSIFLYKNSSEFNKKMFDFVKENLERISEQREDYRLHLSALAHQMKRVEDYFRRVDIQNSQVSIFNFMTDHERWPDSGYMKMRHDYLVSNEEALQWFASDDAKRSVWSVMNGSVESERHDIMTSHKFPDLNCVNGKLHSISNPVFLYDDDCIDEEISRLAKMNIYEPFLAENELHYKMESSLFHKPYVTYVVIPEGLISLLEKKFWWSREIAEQQFLVPVMSKDDFEEGRRQLDQELRDLANPKPKPKPKPKLTSPTGPAITFISNPKKIPMLDDKSSTGSSPKSSTTSASPEKSKAAKSDDSLMILDNVDEGRRERESSPTGSIDSFYFELPDLDDIPVVTLDSSDHELPDISCDEESPQQEFQLLKPKPKDNYRNRRKSESVKPRSEAKKKPASKRPKRTKQKKSGSNNNGYEADDDDQPNLEKKRWTSPRSKPVASSIAISPIQSSSPNSKMSPSLKKSPTVLSSSNLANRLFPKKIPISLGKGKQQESDVVSEDVRSQSDKNNTTNSKDSRALDTLASNMASGLSAKRKIGIKSTKTFTVSLSTLINVNKQFQKIRANQSRKVSAKSSSAKTSVTDAIKSDATIVARFSTLPQSEIANADAETFKVATGTAMHCPAPKTVTVTYCNPSAGVAVAAVKDLVRKRERKSNSEHIDINSHRPVKKPPAKRRSVSNLN